MNWIEVLTIIGANVGLFFWLRSEANSDRREFSGSIRAMQNEIHKDMKDFHGRLERQDAEFKGIMAKQDAEFKAHLMYGNPKLQGQHGST